MHTAFLLETSTDCPARQRRQGNPPHSHYDANRCNADAAPFRRDYRDWIPAPAGMGSNVMTAVQDWGIIGPGSSDADLARAAAAGDRVAFAGIYDRYADRLYDFCAGMLADRDAAADCVQDAFCEAATCLSDLREPDKLRPWLYGIARHRCLRRIRDRRREQPSDALPEVVSTDAGPDVMASRTELANLIAEAAGGLSDRDRSVLELSYRHGLDGPELAEALDVSQTNANTMVYRLRETMERCLGALLVCRRSRSNRNGCPELAGILQGWDGQFTILMRKRVARHIESCAVCEGERRRLLNPVALLGGAPVFLPAPAWLRESTLDRIRLTSAGSGMETDAGSPNRAAPEADVTVRLPAADVTERLPGVDVTERMPVPVPVPGPRDAIWTATEVPPEHDPERRSRRMLLLALLVSIPLMALGFTIVWLYMSQSSVAPSGVTETAPASTNGNPTGPPGVVAPSDAGTPSRVGPGVTSQPAPTRAPAPGAVTPAAPAPTNAQSAPRQTTRQPRSSAPLPPSQPNTPAPKSVLQAPPPPPEPEDPGSVELPQTAQAPAPEPEEPPVPIQDQIVIQPKYGDHEPEMTTVPYPR